MNAGSKVFGRVTLLAGPLPAPADGRQTQAQVLEQAAVHREVRARARVHHPATRAVRREQPCGIEESAATGTSARSATYAGVKPDTAAASVVESVDVLGEELPVAQPLA